MIDKDYKAFLRRMVKTHKKCGYCVDGIDGESDGYNTYAGICKVCNGSGWIPTQETNEETQTTET